MQRVAITLCALAVAVLGLTPRASANPEVNSQIFRMSPHPGDLFTVLSSDVPESWYWSVSGTLIYGSNSFVFLDKTGDETMRHGVIEDQLTLDLTGSVSLGGWVDLGVALPIFLLNQGEEEGFTTAAGVDTGAIGSTVLGDLRISPKVRLLQRDEGGDGVGIAVDLLTTLPTGDGDSFVSDGLTFQPGLIADLKIGPILIAGNLGWRVRSEVEVPFLEVGDEFYWRLGSELRIVGSEELGAIKENRDIHVAAVGEIYGNTADFSDPNNLSFEGVLGMKLRLAEYGINLHAGGGTGFVQGYGNTKVRLFAGLGYSPPVDRDRDGDGILDVDDECPLQPEDFDGFEDEDGCPDPDNDGDGILDVDDECPNAPEDFDGFEDSDGCPDLDNDGDGIPDADDECPMEPETRNGYQDEDGCPDEHIVTWTKSAIELNEKVYFDFDKASIKEISYPVLRAVANILAQYPEIERVRVEGHTDYIGAASYNKRLSQRRAESVRAFLINEGIEADRVEAVGYGEERPAVEGRTDAAREANRRVEVRILEQRPIKRTIDKRDEDPAPDAPGAE